MRLDDAKNNEERPAAPQGFQHISEILPKVLNCVFEQAALQQDDRPSSSGDRVRWAA